VFSNRVIRQFADHLLGADLIINPEDFMLLRLVFRKGGGSWEKLFRGDIQQLTFLERIISKWGQSPDRKREPKDE